MRTALLCALLTLSSASAQDLSFESDVVGEAPAGWDVAGSGTEGFSVTVEPEETSRALRIARIGDGQYASVVARADSLTRGAVAVRLRGSLRADSVRGLSGLWLRFEDADGEILAFENMFSETPFVGTRDWTPVEIVLPSLPGAAAVWFGVVLGGDGALWVDSLRIDRVTADEVGEPSPVALTYLDAALDSLEAHSLHRDSTDWSAVRARAQAWLLGAQTLPETYRAIRVAAQSVDRHSGFYSPEAAEALRDDPTPVEAGSVSSPSASMLDGRVGYLSVPSFQSVNEEARQAYADTLVAAIERLDAQDVRGWIVDLRENGGGNMHPMLSGLYPLLDSEPVGAFVGRDGERSPWVVLPPGAAPPSGPASVAQDASRTAEIASADAPVAVLVGPGTGSSGEVVALAFRGRPRTTLVGTPTAGLTTGNDFVDLSDGAILNVTTSVYADRTGRTYGGPVEPDLIVADPGAEEDPTLEAALRWLADLP